jgi:hypothetical protein
MKRIIFKHQLAQIKRLYTKNKMSIKKIAETLGFGETTVARYITQMGVKHRSNNKYPVNLEVLTSENANAFYLLGAYIADGNIEKKHKSTTITSKDADWLETIRDILSPSRPLYQRKDSKAKTLKICDKIMWEWLKSHGCFPAKSNTVKFPKIPKKYLPDFIRGCIDGDGWITLSNSNHISRVSGEKYTRPYYVVGLCSGSEDFIKGFARVLDMMHIRRSSIRAKSNTGILKNGRAINQTHPVYAITFTGRTALAFLSWVYYPGHALSMKRKRKNASVIMRYYNENQYKRYVA